MVEICKIDLKDKPYDVLVGQGLISGGGKLIAERLSPSSVFIISDKNTSKLYGNKLKSSLKAVGFKFHEVVIPAGEKSKSFASYAKVMESLLARRPDRKALVVALGGGVAGDLGGFVASTLLRGVDFVQVPTTLLAQVDSSVGGKNGINSKYGKNLTGTFYQPKLVIADTKTLSTLPKRIMIAGYAEVVKYAFINDAKFFDWLEENAAKALKGAPKELAYMVAKCVAAKARIVEADEREAGRRMLLNLGHTFGHGLEAITGFDEKKLMHGEAVAIGMAMAFSYSAELGLCDKKEAEKVAKHLKKVGLPIHPKDRGINTAPGKFMQAMQGDKKAEKGKLKLVLARSIGGSFVYAEENPQSLLKFIASYLGK